jgi:prepilin-type N-terminal cleavage/methylation domain-containing protein
VFERHQEIMKRRNSGEASENGFTLIELLIVIVVLGILAAIVVFSLTGVSGQSKAAACTTDGKTVEVAVDAYEATNGTALPSGFDVNTLTGTYLHSAPSGNGYTISVDSVSGAVSVDTGNGTPVPYLTGCKTLG